MQKQIQHLDRLNAQRLEYLTAKQTKMDAITEDGGRTFGNDELEEVEKIQAQIDNIDKTIATLEQHIAQLQEQAKPAVTPNDPTVRAAKNYGHSINITAHTLDKGELAGQYITACLLHRVKRDQWGTGNVLETINTYNAMHGMDPNAAFSPEIANMFAANNMQKVQAQMATTGSNPYLGYMADPAAKAFGEIIDMISTTSVALPILQAARQVPNFARPLAKTTNGTAGWVSEGGLKQVSTYTIDGAIMQRAKVATIRTASIEMLEAAAPFAANSIIKDLQSSIAISIDEAFFTAALDTTTGAPEGIWYYSTAVTPVDPATTGKKLQQQDLINLVNAARANPNASRQISQYLMVLNTNYAFNFWGADQLLSQLNSPKGIQYNTPETPMIGMFANVIPMIMSDFATDAEVARKATIGIIDRANLLASIGGLTFRTSDQATITDGSQTYSTFQNNAVAFLMEQRLTWRAMAQSTGTRPGAYIDASAVAATSLLSAAAPISLSAKASK